jgi:hypothetical protein
MAHWLCLCLAASPAWATSADAAPSFRFRSDASDSATAVYHVACLSGQIPCTREAFERFWRGTLQWKTVDQQQLDAWTATLTDVAQAAGPASSAPYLGNSRSFLPGVDAKLRIAHAAIESASASDFHARTRRWLTPDAAKRVRGALDHFRERLRPWWRAGGRAAGAAHLRRLDDELRNDAVRALARRIASFVEAESPARDIHDGFAEAYLRAGVRELAGDLESPLFVLSAAAVLPSEKAADAYQVFLDEFEPVSFIKSEEWRLFPRMNLVFLASYDELGAFSSAFPDLASHATKRGFAYRGSRDGRASVFVLAGADAAAIVEVVRAFANLRSASAAGVLLSIE